MNYERGQRVILKENSVSNKVFTDEYGIDFMISYHTAKEIFLVLYVDDSKLMLYNDSLFVGGFMIDIDLIDGDGLALGDIVKLSGSSEIYYITDFNSSYVDIKINFSYKTVPFKSLKKVERKIIEVWEIIKGVYQLREEEYYE